MLPLGSALLLCALVAVVYANSLPNDFVFDDHTLISINPEVNPAFAEALEQRSVQYRPVRTLSYVIDRVVAGHHPWSYRAGNMFYHALTGCAALVVYRQLGLSSTVAALAAAIFVAHPVQTESVAYVSGRRDVLSGLFVLLAFSLFLRWREPDGRGRHLAGVALALVCGLLTKETVFAFPIVAVAYDLTVSLARQRAASPSMSSSLLAVVRRGRAIYAMMALLSVAALGYLSVRGLPTSQPWWGGSVVCNFLNVALLWVHSGVLLLFPIRLLADYSYEAVPLVTSAASPLGWAAVAVLLTLFLVSCGNLRRAPVSVFLLWWIPATLLPSSHMLPHHDFFAEHFLYLPLFGFAGLLALGVHRAGVRLGLSRRLVEAGGLAIVLLLGARTVLRNRDWRDDLTLWRVTSEAVPRCARAHGNYAGALLAQGNIDAAQPEFRAALRIEPRQRVAMTGMIMIHHAKGRLRQRDALLQRVMNRLGYTNLLALAGWFLVNGEYPLAIRLANEASFRYDADDRAWTVEGWARVYSGQFEQALGLFDKALQKNPRSQDARAGRDFCHQKIRG